MKTLEGKKTYAMIAGIAVSAAAGYASRHGIDLGPFTPDLTDVLIALFSAGAAWARSVAKPAVSVTDTQATPSTGPQF